jgi:hypothetical protein
LDIDKPGNQRNSDMLMKQKGLELETSQSCYINERENMMFINNEPKRSGLKVKTINRENWLESDVKESHKLENEKRIL